MKRINALFIGWIAVVGLVTGCGGDDDDDEPTPSPFQSSSSAVAAPTSEPRQRGLTPVGEEYDFRSDPELSAAEGAFVEQVETRETQEGWPPNTFESDDAAFVDLLIRRGQLYCDGIRQGETGAEMINLASSSGDLTADMAATLVLSAVLNLCPELAGRING